mmetsp:Transcript_8688/g.19037  ORF Transcript_8688/g.19037 Transcript_8688/m.19037 type:complete len:89 (-) Transcript_8688:1497-1763(-)
MTSEFLMVERRWATEMVVRLLPLEDCRSSIASWTCFSDSLSNAEVASSKRSSWGFLTRARAMARRCFCPPDICPPPTPMNVPRPSGRA